MNVLKPHQTEVLRHTTTNGWTSANKIARAVFSGETERYKTLSVLGRLRWLEKLGLVEHNVMGRLLLWRRTEQGSKALATIEHAGHSAAGSLS